MKVKEKILLLRYRFIGDTILTVPFLRNLRRAKPDAIIHLVVAPLSGEVLQGIPYVDRILYWDPRTIHGDCLGTHKTLMDKWRFIRDLREVEYNKVYILKRSFSSAVMGFLTGAPKRVGFYTEGRRFLLTTSVPYDRKLHEVQNFLNCLRWDGIYVEDNYLEAWIKEDERKEAAKFLINQGWDPGEPFIAIHPFAAVKERSWPLDRFIMLANLLYRQRGWHVLWLGGSNDSCYKARISTVYRGKSLMAVGNTNIRQSMAMLSFASLFIGNDSGIMHLAAALKIPLLAIFGPQSKARFGPWGDNSRCRVISKKFPCHPCRQNFFSECLPGPEGRPPCLESISVKEVMREIDIFDRSGCAY